MRKRYEVAIRAKTPDGDDDKGNEITLLVYKHSKIKAEAFVEAFRCLIGLAVVDVTIVDDADRRRGKISERD